MSNTMHAEIVSRKLARLLGVELRFEDLEDSPQQVNGSDCGVFVCLQMKYLLEKRLLKADAHQQVSMSLARTDINASEGRKRMLQLIEGFRREGEKRRSYVFFCYLGDVQLDADLILCREQTEREPISQSVEKQEPSTDRVKIHR